MAPNLCGGKLVESRLGAVLIGLEPKHCYSYLDARRPHITADKRELEVLSHAFTRAVQWGLVRDHPIKGKLLLDGVCGSHARDRYAQDRELAEAPTVASPLIRAYIGVKVLTGLRRGDILTLRMADIQEDGTAHGSDSIWQRFMDEALAKTRLEARFQERDLRAKVASDLPLALASALLGHADPKLTQRVYRRRPDVLRPRR